MKRFNIKRFNLKQANLNLTSIFFMISILFLLSAKVSAHNKVIVVPLGTNGGSLQNVVTVAKKNGDFISPAAAINSINNASASNPYLVVIAPGIYTLTEALTMKAYVDVVGSGETMTTLTGAISASTRDKYSSIIVGSNNSSIKNLTIENSGGNNNAIGIYNTNGCSMLSDVTINVYGGIVYNYGIRASSCDLKKLTVNSTGGNYNFGIKFTSSNFSAENLKITVKNADAVNYGIASSFSTVKLNNVTVTSSGVGSHAINSNNSAFFIRQSWLSGETIGLFLSNSIFSISSSSVINGAGGSPKCINVDNGAGIGLDSRCRALP